MSDEVLVWLSVCSEVQTVCIWSSWCHCIPKPRHLMRHLNPDWFLPFSYRLTLVVLGKRPLTDVVVVVVPAYVICTYLNTRTKPAMVNRSWCLALETGLCNMAFSRYSSVSMVVRTGALLTMIARVPCFYSVTNTRLHGRRTWRRQMPWIEATFHRQLEYEDDRATASFLNPTRRWSRPWNTSRSCCLRAEKTPANHALITSVHCTNHTPITSVHCTNHTPITTVHCTNHTPITTVHCTNHTLITTVHCT